MVIKELIPWMCSITSIAMIWWMGNKSIKGPILGLISQVFWFAYVFLYWKEAQGLLPCTIAFTIVHIRNTILWSKR